MNGHAAHHYLLLPAAQRKCCGYRWHLPSNRTLFSLTPSNSKQSSSGSFHEHVSQAFHSCILNEWKWPQSLLFYLHWFLTGGSSGAKHFVSCLICSSQCPHEVGLSIIPTFWKPKLASKRALSRSWWSQGLDPRDQLGIHAPTHYIPWEHSLGY